MPESRKQRKIKAGTINTSASKAAAAALAVVLASGAWAGSCFAQDSEDPYPSIPHMTYEEYPEVDGSLACVPLMEALIRQVTGCSEAQAEESLINFSNTNPSYERLKMGEAELILSYEASEEYKKRLDQLEGLELSPVGKDALVFLANEANPVDGLTRGQIHDIYTGTITNWKEVGGEDLPIRAFQRREASGSQTLMRLLLMGDEEIPEKQMVRIEGMEGLIDALLEYDNSANALGYSVYYYASSMYHQDGLKFLAVDGIKPVNDTIRSGQYPLTHPFYVGIGEHSGENAHMLADWLLSEEGQRFVEDQGYVAAGEN